MANNAEMFLLGKFWNAIRRGARSVVLWRPFRRDPLESLVETARRLDYGCGRLPEATGPGRESDSPCSSESEAAQVRGRGRS
jgi:hypothetical protein